MNLNKRDKVEILEYLKLITSELTDAYNSTPDTSENSDALYFIDTARAVSYTHLTLPTKRIV